MRSPLKLAAAVVGCELVGVLGTPFTIAAIPTWYAGLQKPFFSPPNWLFGPVWTGLYLMMGVAAYLIWTGNGREKERRVALRLFLLQLMLNFLWSGLFFGLHSPILGLLDIAALWMVIAVTIETFSRIDKRAAWLMVPYLIWVSFASVLNFFVMVLNY